MGAILEMIGKKRIDFIGIGGSKSATSWVAEILRKHPDIYYPEEKKELDYFNAVIPQDYKSKNINFGKPIEWYHRYFKNAKEGQILGEISPTYMGENCAEEIYKYNPDVKIFVILRQPIDRSFSQYKYSKQNGIARFNSYQEAIDKFPQKFLENGLYYPKLKNYFDIFPRENIKVLFFDDVKKDNRKFMTELYDFLGVKVYFPDDFDKKVNVGLQPKSQGLMNFIGKIQVFFYSSSLRFFVPFLKKIGVLGLVKKVKNLNLTKREEGREVLDPEFRQELVKYFEEDLNKLEILVEKDLSHWKR